MKTENLTKKNIRLNSSFFFDERTNLKVNNWSETNVSLTNFFSSEEKTHESKKKHFNQLKVREGENVRIWMCRCVLCMSQKDFVNGEGGVSRGCAQKEEEQEKEKLSSFKKIWFAFTHTHSQWYADKIHS